MHLPRSDTLSVYLLYLMHALLEYGMCAIWTSVYTDGRVSAAR